MIRNHLIRYGLPAIILCGCFPAILPASAVYTNIVIDGDPSDWSAIPSLVSDPPGDNGTGPDLATVQVANDSTHLYLRITYHAPVNPNAGPHVFLALDNDGEPSTGFDIFGMGTVGSEAGWQNDFPFAQSNGVFNSGSLSNAAAAIAPFSTITTQQEYSISRAATFATGGGPVFPQPAITLLVYTDPTGANETAGPIPYSFVSPVETPAVAQVEITDVVAFAVTNSRTDLDYRLQFRTPPTLDTWTGTGFDAVGTGEDLLFYDPTAYSTAKQYRVLATLRTPPVVQLLIPFYTSPANNPGAWNVVAEAATRIPVTAVINPRNGPVPDSDPDYTGYPGGLSALSAAGVTTLGYVYTQQGNRDINTVKADIDLYNSAAYDVDGIFLDEVADQPTTAVTGGGGATALAYYADLYDYIAGTNSPNLHRVFGNPGTQAGESYFTEPAFDTLVLFEDGSGWVSYQPDAYLTNGGYSADRFGMLAHSVSSTNDVLDYIALAESRNFGYVFVTDDTLPNPWNALPSYFDHEVRIVEDINGAAP